MKVITLWQPWASLMSVGAKSIETRHWGSAYCGVLAIHAACGWNSETAEFCKASGVWKALEPFRQQSANQMRPVTESSERCRSNWLRDNLPRGAIVGVCKLVDSVKMAYCGDCDGCGWVEGGKTLKTKCGTCAGTGVGIGRLTQAQADLFFGDKLPISLSSNRCAWVTGVKLAAEDSFGNYCPGRYALITANMQRLATPVSYKSRQGKLLDLPADVEALVMAELRRAA